jgi:hypothetical protein
MHGTEYPEIARFSHNLGYLGNSINQILISLIVVALGWGVLVILARCFALQQIFSVVQQRRVGSCLRYSTGAVRR